MCETCLKVFSQKGHLEDHANRKRPCKQNTTLEDIIEEKIQKALFIMNHSVSKIDSDVSTQLCSNMMDYSSKTRKELIAFCKEKGIKGYSGKKKEDLCMLLCSTPSAPSTTTTIQTNTIVYNVPSLPSASHEHAVLAAATTATTAMPLESADTGVEDPTFIEVCAGCGGLSTGFMNVGFKPLLINELIPTFCDTLRKNHSGANVNEGSMLGLDLSAYKGKVSVLQGGVPCQAFSQAGERKGLEDPRGKLIVEFNRLINQCEPRMFLVENVKGLITHNDGETLKQVIKLFENKGKYKVSYKLLNAKDYEVPQKRERIFIVGVHHTIEKEFVFPEKSSKKVVLREVLTDVPPSPGAKYPEHKAKVLALVPEGGCWVDLPESIQKEYMGKSMEAGGGKRGIAKRLAMDDYSLTLTTSPCQKQTERCHPIETRPLNVREYARIQTFPDSYVFSGNVNNQYKQIGNAVPVKLAMAMGAQIKTFLRQTSATASSSIQHES